MTISKMLTTTAASLMLTSILLSQPANASAPASMTDAQIIAQTNVTKLAASLANSIRGIARDDLKKYSADVMIQLNRKMSKTEAEATLSLPLNEVIGGDIATASLTSREILFLTGNAAVVTIEVDGPLHPNPSFTAGN